MTGTMSMTTTTVSGITLKSIPMTTMTTMQIKRMATSSVEQTVRTTMTMAMMLTSMKTDSSKQFGTKESCRKASESHRCTTSTTITTVSQTQKTPMTITTVSSMLIKHFSQVASGVKKNPHSITTMTESSIGQTMTGMATVFRTTLNLQSASRKRSTTTMTAPETTSTKTMTKTV